MGDADLDAAYLPAEVGAGGFAVGVCEPKGVVDRFGGTVHVAVDVDNVKTGHLLGGGDVAHIAAVDKGGDPFLAEEAQGFEQVADVVVGVG